MVTEYQNKNVLVIAEFCPIFLEERATKYNFIGYCLDEYQKFVVVNGRIFDRMW
jgi:hypothetical protein